MRISDWSSDVCSSDLGFLGGFGAIAGGINIKKKEANVTLTLVNARTTEQERLTAGYARKSARSFGAGRGGFFGGGFAAVGGGEIGRAAWRESECRIG